jgi:hypothetical protein
MFGEGKNMTRCKWLSCLFVVMLVLIPGVGCRKRTADTGNVMPVPQTQGESGWPVYEVKSEGFAIELPPDWRQVDMDPKTFEAHFNEALQQNPEMAPMLANVRQQVAAGVKFFGFDQKTMGTGFATNVNVIRLPIPPGTTLDSAVAATIKESEALPGAIKPVTHERVKSANGDRERVHLKLTMKMANGQSQTVASTQYLLVSGNNAFAITLTTLPDKEATYTAIFDRIGQSFRFIK